MEDKPPTIEELQAQLLALQSKNEELETQLAGTTDDLNKTQDSLKEVRSINSKLWKTVNLGPENKQEPTEPEAPTPEQDLESILKDAIEPKIAHMKKIYGVDNIGNYY